MIPGHILTQHPQHQFFQSYGTTQQHHTTSGKPTMAMGQRLKLSENSPNRLNYHLFTLKSGSSLNINQEQFFLKWTNFHWNICTMALRKVETYILAWPHNSTSTVCLNAWYVDNKKKTYQCKPQVTLDSVPTVLNPDNAWLIPKSCTENETLHVIFTMCITALE